METTSNLSGFSGVMLLNGLNQENAVLASTAAKMGNLLSSVLPHNDCGVIFICCTEYPAITSVLMLNLDGLRP